jgi:hypothetical protein
MAAGEEHETDRPRRSPGGETARKSSDGGDGGRTSGTKHATRGVSMPQAMRYAVEQLQEFLGQAPESVSAVKPTEDGWQADVEVLELERVPATTSVMASYRVTLDREGELMSYERIRRYTRGQTDRRS